MAAQEPNPLDGPKATLHQAGLSGPTGQPLVVSQGRSGDRLRSFLTAVQTSIKKPHRILIEVSSMLRDLITQQLIYASLESDKLILASQNFGAVILRYVPPSGANESFVEFYSLPILSTKSTPGLAMCPTQASIRLVQSGSSWSWSSPNYRPLDGAMPSADSLAEVLLRLFAGGDL